jgi:putative endonuclease
MTEDLIRKGRRGEDAAAEYLIMKGYKILERNWRYGHKEVDIILKDRNTTVFVEVKYRRAMGGERYNELINTMKQKSLLSVSNAFMISRKRRGPVRFDIVFIIGEGDERSIEHIEDAFSSWG